MYKFSDVANLTEIRDQFYNPNIEKSDSTPEIVNNTSKAQNSKKKKSKKKSNVDKNKLISDNTVIKHEQLYLELCGFRNVRNSCFLNVCLQFLLRIPSLCSIIHNNAELKLSKQCAESKSLIQSLAQLIHKLNPKHAIDSNKTGIRNTGVRRLQLSTILTPAVELRKILHMDNGQQEDVAECLMVMLSQLHQELINPPTLQPDPTNHDRKTSSSSSSSSHVTNQSQTSNTDDNCGWFVTDRTGKHHPEAKKIELEKGQSVIKQLFTGTLIIRSYCAASGSGVDSSTLSCGDNEERRKCFAHEEPFFILPLEINNPQITSVEAGLRFLVQSEQITDYHHVTGERIINMRRRSVIASLPTYFIIQLNRFNCSIDYQQPQQKTSGMRIIQKQMKLIHIPYKLTIQKSLLNQASHFHPTECRYHIWAIIFHIGDTVTSGHYTIAIKHDDQWSNITTTTTDGDDRRPQSADHHQLKRSFLYFDDQDVCLVSGEYNLNLLINTHSPLDAKTGTFIIHDSGVGGGRTEQQQQHTIQMMNDQSNRQLPTPLPRVPYIVIYESAQQIGDSIY